ncbi:MAG: hypothetical protein IJC14_01985, partial [Firmicutes bacterium]|nr:hypothetical protein [Bacillota bacterium]
MERKRAFCEDVLVRVCAIILAILIVFTGGIIFPEKSSFKTEEYEAGEGAFRFMWPESGVLRAEAETVTVTETKELTDVAYYDIWKHINGTWQFGKKQGSSVSSTFTIYIAGRLPEGAVVTSVSGSFDDGYSGAYSSYSVPSASISVKSFDNKNLTYSVSTTLNGTPMNLRQDSQSEYTEGYRYYIPAAFEVTYTLEKEVSDTDPDSGNTGDSGTGDEDNSANIDGEAILDLPDITYEGHSVKAEDRSIFDVDGESYGAARFYDEGYGSNKFTASGSSRVKRIDDTEAEVTFNSPGSNTVTLKVTTDSGNTLTDKEDIEVLRTPAILETLGGVQKENRRQVLTILVAENPSYPLTELWVEIEKKGGSERVHLDHDLSIAGGAGSGTNTNDNSTLVKTRAISDTGSDSKFTRVELEFLTKNTEEMTMTYRIYAEDSRGNTDTVEKNFVVYPDMAPSVVIDSENP